MGKKKTEDGIEPSETGLLLNAIKSLTLLKLKAGDNSLKKIRKILRKPTAWKLITYLLDNKVASTYELRKEFDISKQSVYRSLNFLIDMGLVVKARTIKTGSKGAPYTMYGLVSYEPEDLRNAYEHDRRLRTPAYKEVERVSQIILDNYLVRESGEIDMESIEPIIKKECRGVLWYDIKRGVQSKLKEAGYQIVI